MESLFAAIKHQFGLKDAWQQSRQVLMRWVTLVAVGYAISQILAFTSIRPAFPASPIPRPGVRATRGPPG